MAFLNYTLQKKSIALMVTLENVTHKFYTRISIDPSNWYDKNNKQYIKGNGMVIADQNDFLNKFREAVESKILEERKGGRQMTKVQMKDFIDKKFFANPADVVKNSKSFLEYFKREIETSELAEGTLDNYRGSYKNIVEYLKKKGKVDVAFENVDIAFYNDYKKFLVKSGKYGQYGIDTKIKILRTIMSRSFTEKLHKNNDYVNFERPKRTDLAEDTIHIFCNEKELQQIFELKLVGQEKEIIDMFLFACYTAMRFEDIVELEPANFINSDEGYTLDYIQIKTRGRVRVPIIFKNAVTIAKRNNFQFKKYSNNVVNDTVRAVVNRAGLLQERIKVDTSHTKGVFKKVELLSFHVGRKSFATNCYLKKIPNNLTMQATGHKSESVFLGYIKASQMQKAEGLAAYRDY